MPEEESLEATSENHRGCGRDVLRQTVPNTGKGNKEGSPNIYFK